MFRPIFTLAIVCVLASACADKGPSAGTGAGDKAADTTAAAQKRADEPSQSAPAAQNAAPAPAAAAPSTAVSEPKRDEPSASASNLKPTPAPAPTRAAAAAAPAAPKTPAVREVTIPAGKQISVTLTTPVASDTSKVEDSVRGTLAAPIVVSGTTVVPAGAEVTGTVIEANESGRVKGRASIAFRFERLIVRDESHDIRTARISRQAASSQRDDLKKGGIGAGVGAVVGGIVGGKKGAVIGAGAGGAGAVLATKGNEIRLPAGTTVTTTLQDAVTIPIPLTAK